MLATLVILKIKESDSDQLEGLFESVGCQDPFIK